MPPLSHKQVAGRASSCASTCHVTVRCCSLVSQWVNSCGGHLLVAPELLRLAGEYETDSGDEERQMLKPTFTQRKDRETIAERERRAKEEAAALADKTRQLELRKADTHTLVIDQLRVGLAVPEAPAPPPLPLCCMRQALCFLSAQAAARRQARPDH